MLKIKNPIVFFFVLWLFVLYLYSKQYSLLLTDLNNLTIIYILLTGLSLLISYCFVRMLFTHKFFEKKKVYDVNFGVTNFRLKKIFKIWLFFTLIEVIYFKGLPLLSLIGIGSGRYTEWGIPSLHGFLNAMVITFSNYLFYFYLKKKDKKYLYGFLVCILWPILLMTRQMFMSMIIMATIIYILTNKIKLAAMLKVVFCLCLVIYVFGWAGDLRSGSSIAFINLVQPSSDYPTWLPSGFLWVYVYMVSPLNNLNFNIDIFPNLHFDPSPLISSFFPSFLRKEIFPSSNQFNFQLVNENLNVSSMFPKYLDSFGYFGSLLFYFFLGLFISFVYFKFKSKNTSIKWLFILVIIFHNIILSVFVDFFFNLVFLFQMFLHLYIAKSPKKKTYVKN
ncbi:O-antigen polymerase [uncultured Polaribacter sp.]|uniref:O-antigen polymerase n=1 Tax=uncultured Polaribacter sp. TaxID=174711 RepID=UPI00262C8F0D|nr:O-antigen polymerase [uncultured Polaribacter sp.]